MPAAQPLQYTALRLISYCMGLRKRIDPKIETCFSPSQCPIVMEKLMFTHIRRWSVGTCALRPPYFKANTNNTPLTIGSPRLLICYVNITSLKRSRVGAYNLVFLRNMEGTWTESGQDRKGCFESTITGDCRVSLNIPDIRSCHSTAL